MSDWSRWFLIKSKTGWSIRRSCEIDGKRKWQRLPKEKYAHLNSETDLNILLRQLNLRYETELAKAREAYEIRHAFISQKILDDFKDHLHAQIPTKRTAGYLYTSLRNGLLWFITVNGIVDPVDWKKNEDKWGLALLSKLEGEAKIWEEPAHPDTISKQIQVMNRFLAFLHKRIPEQIPAITLDPISKAQLRLYKAEWNEDYNPGKFIPQEDWLIIERDISAKLKPFLQLAYYYGLRRSEALAIDRDCIRSGHLKITRQLESMTDGKPGYGPLKNRKPRKVEYWFSTAEQTFEIVQKIQVTLHPDTFSHVFADEMKRLKMDYSIHDFRRTFITRAFRSGKSARDIQLSVGHSDLKTTMRYAQDDRELGDDEIYKPKAV